MSHLIKIYTVAKPAIFVSGTYKVTDSECEFCKFYRRKNLIVHIQMKERRQ